MATCSHPSIIWKQGVRDVLTIHGQCPQWRDDQLPIDITKSWKVPMSVAASPCLCNGRKRFKRKVHLKKNYIFTLWEPWLVISKPMSRVQLLVGDFGPDLPVLWSHYTGEVRIWRAGAAAMQLVKNRSLIRWSTKNEPRPAPSLSRIYNHKHQFLR